MYRLSAGSLTNKTVDWRFWLLPDGLGRIWDLQPQHSPSKRCHWRLLVPPTTTTNNKKEFKDRHNTVWEQCKQESLKKGKYSPKMWELVSSKESCTPWGCSFYFSQTVVNKWIEYSLLEEGIFWKQDGLFRNGGYVLFPLFGQGFPIMAPLGRRFWSGNVV